MGKNTSYLGNSLTASDFAIPCGKFNSYYPEGNFQIIEAGTAQ